MQCWYYHSVWSYSLFVGDWLPFNPKFFELFAVVWLSLVSFSDSSIGKESACKTIRLQCRRPRCNSWVRNICWRKDRLPTPVFLGFPWASAGKESVCNVGDLGSIPGLGRFPGEGKGYPLQYSGLENFMDYSPWGHKGLDTIERLSIHFASLGCLGNVTRFPNRNVLNTSTLKIKSIVSKIKVNLFPVWDGCESEVA